MKYSVVKCRSLQGRAHGSLDAHLHRLSAKHTPQRNKRSFSEPSSTKLLRRLMKISSLKCFKSFSRTSLVTNTTPSAFGCVFMSYTSWTLDMCSNTKKNCHSKNKVGDVLPNFYLLLLICFSSRQKTSEILEKV